MLVEALEGGVRVGMPWRRMWESEKDGGADIVVDAEEVEEKEIGG